MITKKTFKNYIKNPLPLHSIPIFQKKILYFFLYIFIFLNIFSLTNTQDKNLTVNDTLKNATSNETLKNTSTPTAPITEIGPIKTNVTEFNPNIYFNANYLKQTPSFINETNLVTTSCFNSLKPIIGLLSDYEQALLIRSSLDNNDQTRCFNCTIYTASLINSIKKETASLVNLLNMESYSRRDPLRCLLNIILSPFAKPAEINSASPPVPQSKPPLVIPRNFMNRTEVIIPNQPNISNQNNTPSSDLTLPLEFDNKTINMINNEISEFIYYQGLSNQCMAKFLLSLGEVLNERRRFFCAKIDDMNKMGIFDDKKNLIGFKWTYKETERITDMFNKLFQCKSLENIIYPQTFNKIYGIIGKSKTCQNVPEPIARPFLNRTEEEIKKDFSSSQALSNQTANATKSLSLQTENATVGALTSP